MIDFPSFLPTHLSLLRLPQSLAGLGKQEVAGHRDQV